MLPRLHLSLTGQGFGVLRASQVVMGLVIVGAIAMSVSYLWEAQVIEEAAKPYEVATKRLVDATGTFMDQSRKAGYDLSDERLKGLEKEVAFTNQMLANRAFSWTRFLTDLEEAVPQHVSIDSVGLSFNKDNVSTITLSGSALTLRDLTALVSRLEGHQAFSGVVLSHHQSRQADADDGGNRLESREIVEFGLTVLYRPISG